MAPKLSVIIPVFNAEQFIRKSYDNILGQDLIDFEIIYVNNNSTDKSLTEIEALQKLDSSVLLLHETKQGAAAARNLGIKTAVGKYLYIFDVDDEIYPGALKRMIEVLDNYPEIDTVFGKMVKSRQGIVKTAKPKDESHTISIQDPPYWGLQWFTDLSTVVGPPAFLYRKSVFETIGYYNEDLVICEDTALDIKLGMMCKIAKIDTYVYLYFVHQQSILQKSKKDISQIFILWSRLVKSHLPFYLEHNVPLKYKELLFEQLFSSMGKIVYYTKGVKQRFNMITKIKQEIKPYSLSLSIRIYLTILALIPINVFLKSYIYYYSPWYVKRHINSF